MLMNHLMCLFDVQGLILKDIETTDTNVIFQMELERAEQPCPNCGALTAVVHDYRTQKIRELAVFGKPTLLLFRKRRYRCGECGKRFMEQNTMLTKYSRMTNRFVQHICDELQKEYSFSSVARSACVSVNTVMRIFDRYVQYGSSNIKDVISIDEFKGNTEKEKYQCIITDPKRKQVLDILPNRYGNQVQAYFNQNENTLLQQVEYFISDMWKPYTDMAKVCSPNASRVIDKYHWIRQVICDVV